MSEIESAGRYPIDGPRSTISKLFLIASIVYGCIGLYPILGLINDTRVVGLSAGDYSMHMLILCQLVVALSKFMTFFAVSFIIQMLSDIRWHLAKNNSFKLGL